jgi:hypothetical protein
MTNNIIHWVKPLTSLKLTVFCFACAMILVFLGTLDQVNIGVYEAENRYFKSFFLYFTLPGTTLKIPWFPSGYLVGGTLLVNLIAAHLARFKFTWKKAGILVLHAGVILLLLGQLFTSLFQVESQMRLDQGETKSYSLSYYHDELAVIDTSAHDFDQVISIPDSQLYKGHKIGLPVDSLEMNISSTLPCSARINCRPRTIHIYRSARWRYRFRPNEPTKRTNATCQLLPYRSGKAEGTSPHGISQPAFPGR